MVRGRLPRKLRTHFDSTDFVQSVWKSFFSDLRSRPLEFANVHHLRAFLAGVVRNKVYEQHRRLSRTAKHALGREERLYIHRGGREIGRDIASPEPTPSQTVQASRSAGTVGRRLHAPRGPGHHASPTGHDLRGDRGAHRPGRADGAPGDRGGPAEDGGPRDEREPPADPPGLVRVVLRPRRESKPADPRIASPRPLMTPPGVQFPAWTPRSVEAAPSRHVLVLAARRVHDGPGLGGGRRRSWTISRNGGSAARLPPSRTISRVSAKPLRRWRSSWSTGNIA